MEGNAGTSRLNPIAEPAENSADVAEPEATQEDEHTATLNSDPLTSEAATSETQPSETQPSETQPSETAASETAASDGADAPFRRLEHIGRGWFAGVCALLLLATAGVGVGGYLGLRARDRSAVIQQDEDVALARAKECVAATQAPDIAAMTQSQTKIIECGTGNFAVQSSLYAGMLVDAYQAANVSVKVSDLRAAVERANSDGSVDVLVAVRVRVTNSQVADQEQGYRLRVQMAPADGTYKISSLDQVTS